VTEDLRGRRVVLSSEVSACGLSVLGLGFEALGAQGDELVVDVLEHRHGGGEPEGRQVGCGFRFAEVEQQARDVTGLVGDVLALQTFIGVYDQAETVARLLPILDHRASCHADLLEEGGDDLVTLLVFLFQILSLRVS